MGIERLYADSIEASYERGLRNPAAPVQPDFRTFSFLSAGFGGLTTGFLEQGASFLEGVASFQRYSDERRAEMGARVPDPERKAEVQRGLDAAGRAARVRAQESAPDPQTAHQADQIIHGLTRFGAKAVGSVVAAGPVGGAALLGAEETNTAYRDLTMRGIDSDTALKVAAVQGAISAAGVVLPISGAGMAATTAGKVAATAGLVAVGGPGAYVAQETLSRDILQRAGYADEAAKHDPTDPLWLALSTLLPGAFGAYSLRGVRTAKPIGPIKTEAGVRDAVQLTPAEQAASDAFERSAANLAELRKEIARQKDPAARAVLEAELAKQTEAAARAGQGAVAEAAARSPELVDAARVSVLQETTRRSLPDDAQAMPRLMGAIDALAAGERPVVEAVTQVKPWQSLAERRAAANPGAPDNLRAMDQHEAALTRAEDQINAGEAVRVVDVAPEVAPRVAPSEMQAQARPTDAPAAATQPAAAADARTIVTNKAGEAFIDTRDSGVRLHGTGKPIAALSDEYALSGDSRNIYGQGFYTTDAADVAAGYMKKGGRNAALYEVQIRDGVRLYDMEQPMSPEVAQIARDNMGDDFPAENSETGAPLTTLREVYDEYRAESRNNGLSRDDVQEVFDGIRYRLEAQGYAGFQHIGGAATGNRAHTVQIFWMPERDVSIAPISRDQFKPNAPTTTQAANPEAAAPAGGAGDEARPGTPQPGRSAPAPEAARVDADITARLLDESPDLRVILPGADEAVPLADALEAIQRQRAQDEMDADLVRAAVLCDLSG